MRSSFKEWLEWATLVVALLAAIYIGGYLLTVHKRFGWGSTGDPSRVYWSVGADFPNRWLGVVFRPALAMDRGYIRRRHWEGWYELNGTNKIYETEMRQKDQERSRQKP